MSTTKNPAESTAAVAPPPNDTKSNNEQLTVSRFLVQNLQAGRGFTTTDYSIDFIKEKHGLYDLVSVVFDILQQEKLTCDRVTSHLWNIELAGTTFKNGWRHVNFTKGTYDRPANSTDVDEGEPRIFASLATPLEKGQKGQCSGESANFDVIVEDVPVEMVDENGIVVKIASPWEDIVEGKTGNGDEASSPLYPKITKVESNTISSSVDDDWIESEDVKTQCLQLRHAWSSYLQGENSWKRDRRTHGRIRAKPQSPPWNSDEMAIIGLLLKSDAKFKKSWNNILQYAFPNRAETADYYMIEHRGRGMTDEDRIRLVKRLAKKRMVALLDRGSPTKEPHPDMVVEANLRKRGIIDGDTGETERKRLCTQYRGIF